MFFQKREVRSPRAGDLGHAGHWTRTCSAGRATRSGASLRLLARAVGLAFAAGANAADSTWADWVEPEVPFFSSVLEVRPDEGQGRPGSLTPRGLVFNLGSGSWACFDVDLLRMAAMWQGEGVTAVALAPGSHRSPARSTPGGQKPAPEPIGEAWFTNGVYPGWQVGQRPSFTDPRTPAPSPEEVGRGPLPESIGRLQALRLVRGGVVLEYRVGATTVLEQMIRSQHEGRPVIERHFQIEPSELPLLLVVGRSVRGPPAVRSVALSVPAGGVGASTVRLLSEDSIWFVQIAAHSQPVRFCVALAEGGTAPERLPRIIPSETAGARWPGEVTTTINRSKAAGAYVVDDVPLPLQNPWRRNVRLADVQFLTDGTGVGVTIDGDVWLIRGLHSPGGTVRWRRFASGLHEPMSLAIRDDQIFAFDRNGIWRLRDTDGDGEADVHELFSNAFAQTADMREFPNGIRLAPGGEFVIAKGGQQATTLGKHNGSVLRVSADGRRATVLGYGFRQPFIGVHPRSGLVTASDQQGQYIPTTPLHLVGHGQFYGFLSGLQPREEYPAPIAEPLTWLPHAVNASAASQVWLFDARLGPLNDALIHIGFNKPELFQVLLNHRGARPQAAVVSLTRDFEFPPLNGAVNPIDGQLYVAGFQIMGWGTTASRGSGLARIRFTGAASTLPREVAAMGQGVLLRFDVALDPAKATNPENFRLASWHYQRTYKYGSPQLKADGTPGMDWLVASSAYLSKDRRSVFVGVPDLKPVMQLRVGWSLASADGMNVEENAYLTPYELAKFHPTAEGFDDLTVDLTPRTAVAQVSDPVNVAEGRRLYQLFGCAACHSIDGTSHASIGPTWKGLFGTSRPLAKSRTVLADEAYLRESMLDPAAKLTVGYQKSEYAMPSYAGVLTESQIESLILFIKSLK